MVVKSFNITTLNILGRVNILSLQIEHLDIILSMITKVLVISYSFTVLLFFFFNFSLSSLHLSLLIMILLLMYMEHPITLIMDFLGFLSLFLEHFIKKSTLLIVFIIDIFISIYVIDERFWSLPVYF